MISVKNLKFSYTNKPFIEDMNFDVKSGEIFGFLGPSGAGKSTLQKIMTGLIRNYSGSVTSDGAEIKDTDKNYYLSIGVDFEFPSLYYKLTAEQNLRFFASLYPKTRDIDELLAKVGLLQDKDKKVSAYSKGMKSRLNFIKALLHNPDTLFLDEPTAGLDPYNAHVMKDIIREEKEKGKTIILTTHNMFDAAELCDRVAFISDCAIRALDTPHNLIMRRGATNIKYTYLDNGSEKTDEISLDKTGDDKKFIELIRSNALRSVHSSEPTLNDIFEELAGRSLE